MLGAWCVTSVKVSKSSEYVKKREKRVLFFSKKREKREKRVLKRFIFLKNARPSKNVINVMKKKRYVFEKRVFYVISSGITVI